MQIKKLLKITVPNTLKFESLQLARDADGQVSFSIEAINQLCSINDIDPALMLDSPEDNVAGLIVAWYDRHRQLGGALDSVAEDLIAETIAEDVFGDGVSHKPGRA